LTLASRAGGIDRPISRSASGRARPEGGHREEEADQQGGDRVCVRETGGLVEHQPGCGERETDERGDVFDDERTQWRVARLPEEGRGRLPPHGSLSSRLGEALEQRDPIGHDGDPENDPPDEVPFDSRSGEELLNGECDRQNATDQERRDRGDERPQESCAPVAEWVPCIRGAAPTPQRESEQELVDRVRGRVSCLGKQGGGTRDQSGAELHCSNDEVRQQRDRDGAFVPSAVGCSKRRR